jgi:hypothetical protein
MNGQQNIKTSVKLERLLDLFPYTSVTCQYSQYTSTLRILEPKVICQWLEAFALLRCYSAYFGSCLSMFPDNLSVPSSRDCLTLAYGTDRLSRNADNNYQITLNNVTEEQKPQLQRGVSLKFRRSVVRQLSK